MKLMKTFEDMNAFIESKVKYPVVYFDYDKVSSAELTNIIFKNGLDKHKLFDMHSFHHIDMRDESYPTLVLITTEIEFDKDINEELESALVALLHQRIDEDGYTNIEIYMDIDGNELI